MCGGEGKASAVESEDSVVPCVGIFNLVDGNSVVLALTFGRQTDNSFFKSQ